MRILVTGGAGFIGSHVVEGFLAAGHEVCVLDNLSSGSIQNLPEGVPFVKADLRDEHLERNIYHLEFDIIYHHAAQISVPRSLKYPAVDAEINIFGFLNLMEIARKWKVKRVIYVSSGGSVYGEPAQLPVTEEAPLRPLSPYAISKLSGETYLEYYRQTHGIDYVVLRYANVYGPRQMPQGEAGVASIFMEHIKANTPPTIYCPDNMPQGGIRDYLYVKDCVQANLLALDKGDNQIFNIGSGVGTTTLALWDELLKVSQTSNAPQPLMAGLRPGDIRQVVLNCHKAQKELGWQAGYTLAQGLAETWQWFVQHKPVTDSTLSEYNSKLRVL